MSRFIHAAFCPPVGRGAMFFRRRAIVPALFLLAVAATAVVADGARAQGVAGSPTTNHVFDAASQLWIGGLNDPTYGPGPYPVDLDASAAPWTKQLFAPPNGFGGDWVIHETVVNAGTEPWNGWVETVVPGGQQGVGWNSVLDVRVNGSSIGFTASGGLNLSFAQLVYPGDVLEIVKDTITTRNFIPGGELVTILSQHPTTNVPEPSTATLAGAASGAALLVWRRRRSRR